jgi:ABC-2 type transport system permease protein
MTWQAIARKDYEAAWDSRLLRYLLYFFVATCLIAGYAFPPVTSGEVTPDRFTGFLIDAVGLLLPLIGILVSYNAIVGERESGEINLLLSLPHDRRDVVLGKLAGRGAFLAVGVIGGLLVGGVLVVVPLGEISISLGISYLVYILLTLLFGGIFFGIGLAISTVTVSKQRATIGAFGIFFVFVIVWDVVGDALVFVADRVGLADGEMPNWLRFLHGAEPGMLYTRIVEAVFLEKTSGPYLGSDAPWYLGEWVALVLFGLWVVVPLAIGYWRFEVTDL